MGVLIINLTLFLCQVEMKFVFKDLMKATRIFFVNIGPCNKAILNMKSNVEKQFVIQILNFRYGRPGDDLDTCPELPQYNL